MSTVSRARYYANKTEKLVNKMVGCCFDGSYPPQVRKMYSDVQAARDTVVFMVNDLASDGHLIHRSLNRANVAMNRANELQNNYTEYWNDGEAERVAIRESVNLCCDANVAWYYGKIQDASNKSLAAFQILEKVPYSPAVANQMVNARNLHKFLCHDPHCLE